MGVNFIEDQKKMNEILNFIFYATSLDISSCFSVLENLNELLGLDFLLYIFCFFTFMLKLFRGDICFA